jgi:AbrB family looped-hinge helix DNA binding protein
LKRLKYNVIIGIYVRLNMKGRMTVMTTAAIKISKKGQITIPKEIREKLRASTIYFDIVDDTIMVKAVRDVAGSLQPYAKNVKPGTPMKQIKEKAWEAVAHEKVSKKSS